MKNLIYNMREAVSNQRGLLEPTVNHVGYSKEKSAWNTLVTSIDCSILIAGIWASIKDKWKI